MDRGHKHFKIHWVQSSYYWFSKWMNSWLTWSVSLQPDVNCSSLLHMEFTAYVTSFWRVTFLTGSHDGPLWIQLPFRIPIAIQVWTVTSWNLHLLFNQCVLEYFQVSLRHFKGIKTCSKGESTGCCSRIKKPIFKIVVKEKHHIKY